MDIFIVDAFTAQRFSGNQAGVAVLGEENFPSETFMCGLAGELKHSETVFVRILGENSFHMRYFTPAGEVELCGHATVGAFTVLREEGLLSLGNCQLKTMAGDLSVQVTQDAVWMDMASPKILRTFTPEESAEMYAAYGLTVEDGIEGFVPKLVSTGLADILLPVRDTATLDRAVQNRQVVIELSKQYDAVGFHLFALGEDCIAYCRNFAPRYDIDEEAATGTSNGALSYYLYQYNKVVPEKENLFSQGEGMGKSSQIKSRVVESADGVAVKIGGTGVISLRCHLYGSHFNETEKKG